jgi:hydrogenase maturation protein HypF
MELEFALDGFQTDESYPARLGEDGQQSAIIVDWEPMMLGVINDIRRGVPAGMVSAKFHNTMAESVVTVARRVGEERVALSGGCFQNKYLTERAVRRLRGEGFRPYWHQRVPPNDGGVALGQIVAAARTLRKE